MPKGLARRVKKAYNAITVLNYFLNPKKDTIFAAEFDNGRTENIIYLHFLCTK